MTQPQARPLVRLDVSDLVLDPECQTRAALSQDAVDEYAEAFRAGAKLPPIRVYMVDGQRVVIDGFHRVAAAIAAGQLQLNAEVFGSGTLDLARWTALRMNHMHGLRRTNADKRRAVELALRSPIGIEQTSRVIAEQVGVSQETVVRVRAELEAARAVPVPDYRVGTDGQLHPTKPRKANGSAKPKAAALSESVTLSSQPLSGLLVPDAERADLEALALKLGAAASAIDAARRTLRSLADVPADRRMVDDVGEQLKGLASRLRGAVPVLCPACQGAGCGTCGERGWVFQRDRRTAALGA